MVLFAEPNNKMPCVVSTQGIVFKGDCWCRLPLIPRDWRYTRIAAITPAIAERITNPSLKLIALPMKNQFGFVAAQPYQPQRRRFLWETDLEACTRPSARCWRRVSGAPESRRRRRRKFGQLRPAQRLRHGRRDARGGDDDHAKFGERFSARKGRFIRNLFGEFKARLKIVKPFNVQNPFVLHPAHDYARMYRKLGGEGNNIRTNGT
jgi:hypothetical protein